MPEFSVTDDDLASLKGKVVVVTGCASGIGLATVQELLRMGARVMGGDLAARPAIENGDFDFLTTNVSDWRAQLALFKRAIDRFGHIDHVFANAGIRGTMNLLNDELDANGDLVRPDHSAIDINLSAAIDTIKLGIHHIRKNPKGGSIVAIASLSSFQRFPMYDYAASKHGIHGLVRGLWSEIGPGTEVPVRINGLNPGWTLTGILPEELARAAGVRVQEPVIPARSALICMADESRHGQMVLTCQGKYFELEEHLLGAAEELLQGSPSVDKRFRTDSDDYHALMALAKQAAVKFS